MDISQKIQQQRSRECLSKVRYDNEAQAKRTAGIIARATGRESRTYKCIWCRKWHLTTL